MADSSAEDSDVTARLLDHCFPSDGALPPLAVARGVLLGPLSAHTSSLLFQLAYNRARRGLSTLYIACGDLAGRQTVRPRALCAVHQNHDAALLKLISIKYVTSWSELRTLLSSLHHPAAAPAFAADGLPRGLIIDDLSTLFARRTTAGGTPSDGVSQATPSPSKPEHQNTTMFLALALAMASHAVDYLDAASAEAAAAAAATAPPPMPIGSMSPPPPPRVAASREPSLLVVACSSPAPEVELASRWLPLVLRTAPAGRTAGAYALRCCHGALGAAEAELYYRIGPTGLTLLDDAERRLHPLADQFGPMRTPARALPPPSGPHGESSQAMASLAY